MGDPQGVGPEVSLKAAASPAARSAADVVVVGDLPRLRATAEALGIAVGIRPVRSPGVPVAEGEVAVLSCEGYPELGAGYGQVSASAGLASVRFIEKAVSLAMEGSVQGVVTGPINKEAIRAAGCPHPGHTELFGALTGAKDVRMMLLAEGLTVVHNSTHCSLREACDRCRKDRIVRTLELAREAGLMLLGEEPLMAVAGLNPHAGENGLFGREELEEVLPAIAEAQSRGWRVAGPVPPDTVFASARGGAYDLVIAMYHDQGHIPVKTLGFRKDPTTGRWDSVSGVNVTLGLPIIRTSVDHGTAFDIAGQGIASEQSMVDAILAAARMAEHRKH
jgi:4-hydroxythreonine-4-phosphate dehydrogenase